MPHGFDERDLILCYPRGHALCYRVVPPVGGVERLPHVPRTLHVGVDQRLTLPFHDGQRLCHVGHHVTSLVESNVSSPRTSFRSGMVDVESNVSCKMGADCCEVLPSTRVFS